MADQIDEHGRSQRQVEPEARAEESSDQVELEGTLGLLLAEIP